MDANTRGSDDKGGESPPALATNFWRVAQSVELEAGAPVALNAGTGSNPVALFNYQRSKIRYLRPAKPERLKGSARWA